jgi:hypothetical protein
MKDKEANICQGIPDMPALSGSGATRGSFVPARNNSHEPFWLNSVSGESESDHASTQSRIIRICRHIAIKGADLCDCYTLVGRGRLHAEWGKK